MCEFSTLPLSGIAKCAYYVPLEAYITMLME